LDDNIHAVNQMRNPNRTTAVATRQFFEWLEHKYGGLPLMQSKDAPRVIQRSRLLAQDLQDLFSHRHLAIHIPNFYPRESAIQLGELLAAEAENSGDAKNWKVSTSRGLESSDVFTLGAHMPWNMAVSQNMTDTYFENVPKEFYHRRLSPQIAKRLWPLDQLRLELDEVWPKGANLSRSGSKCMGGGLPRIMLGPTRWKKGLIHVDELGPLNEEKGCFSANIYLKLPNDQGPVLEIWPMNIRSKWDWYRVSRIAASQAERVYD
jgi:hypothetical protein